MAKVISLSEEAYKEMKAAKRKDESFSDVALRLLHETKQRPLSDFAGKWPGPMEELDEIMKIIEEGRKNFKLKEVKF